MSLIFRSSHENRNRTGKQVGIACADQFSKADQLKNLLLSSKMEFLMEAHNGLSAKVCEEAGFAGIWASGLSISASLGVRDNNEASWTQVIDILEFMSDATSIPILVDGDTGYGNFNNMRRLVRKLEQRDIAGVCIEDKLFPKTNSFIGSNQPLADIDEFCGKIKAGKDAQKDDAFCIVARIEALISGWGMTEVLLRAEAYHQAGADAILIHSKQSTPDEILKFCQEWDNRCPVVIVPTTYYKTPTDRFREAKVSATIWANHNMRVSMSAMRDISNQIRSEETLLNVESKLPTIKNVFELVESDELTTAESLYLPKKKTAPKAVILAASRGESLEALTVDKPKAMLDIRGKPLLRRLVDTLNENEINDVTIVRGYKKEAINLAGVNFIDNPSYNDTGSAHSLALAADIMVNDCLICYGDIVFRGEILHRVLEREEDIVIVVDAERHRENIPNAELVKCTIQYDRSYFFDGYAELERFVLNSQKEASGEFIGVIKLSAYGVTLLKKTLKLMEEDGTLASASVAEVIQRLKDSGTIIAVSYITGHWLDVDNEADLKNARSEDN